MSLICTPTLVAAQHQATSKIIDLINNQEYEQAYALALDNQEALEGEPDFDYAFALAAKANNQLNQAVFALERVLQNEPNLVDARLVLAACYFELGNLSASEEEFRKLQNHMQASEEMKASVATYLDAITTLRKRQEQRWQISGTFGLGFDSNPNNGVAEEFIDIPSLGTFSLFQESLENASTYADLQGQVAYVKPIGQHTSMQFAVSLVHAEYEDEFAIDRTFAAASAAVQSKFGVYDLSSTVFYRPLWLDSDILLNYYGVSATASRPIVASLSAGFDIAYSQEDFQDQQGFDRDLVLVKLWLQSNHETGIHKFSVNIGEESSDDNRDFLDRDIIWFGYQWQKQLHRRWQAAFSLNYLDSEYQGVNTLFNTVREDEFFSGEIDLAYAYSSNTKFLGRLTYLSNDSDISLYEYERYKIWLGASYAF